MQHPKYLSSKAKTFLASGLFLAIPIIILTIKAILILQTDRSLFWNIITLQIFPLIILSFILIERHVQAIIDEIHSINTLIQIKKEILSIFNLQILFLFLYLTCMALRFSLILLYPTEYDPNHSQYILNLFISFISLYYILNRKTNITKLTDIPLKTNHHTPSILKPKHKELPQ